MKLSSAYNPYKGGPDSSSAAPTGSDSNSRRGSASVGGGSIGGSIGGGIGGGIGVGGIPTSNSARATNSQTDARRRLSSVNKRLSSGHSISNTNTGGFSGSRNRVMNYAKGEDYAP